jgi:hypothetical protein
MTSFGRLLGTAAFLGLASLAPQHAHAGLLSAGATVQAFYYNGTLAGPEGELPVGGLTSNPTSLAAPVSFQQGASDGSLITVNDTQIIITNLLTSGTGNAYCFSGATGTACTDAIAGFDFLFTGESILGVSVDPSSAPSFLPVSAIFQGNTHLGLQLISANEIRIDITGDDPVQGGQLILNVGITPTTTAAPEPASLILLGSAFVALNAVRRRRAR